jgi:hypothetical protein
MAKELKELTPRSVSYSQWYQDLVIKADLAENSALLPFPYNSYVFFLLIPNMTCKGTKIFVLIIPAA